MTHGTLLSPCRNTVGSIVGSLRNPVVYFLLSQMLGNLLSVAAVWHAGHVHPSGRPIAAWHRAVGRSALIFCSDLPPVPPERAREDSKDSNLPEATEDSGTSPRTFSQGWSGAGRFADEDPLPLSFWMFGKSPRRAILSALPFYLIAPAVNLWGSGSFVLSLFPDLARENRLDTFYPVGTQTGYPYSAGFPRLNYDEGFKRYYDEQGRFEFRYPAGYVQDTSVYLRNADAAYSRRMMDPTLASTPAARPIRRATGPEVAFGPAGSQGEENLSVVIGSLQAGFSLKGTLGPPAEAAERLLQQSIAKPGVRDPTLLSAGARMSERSGIPLYQFEYRVDYPSSSQKPTYTVCVVGAVRDTLFTFASRVPEPAWVERADSLRETAASFVLL